MRVVIITLAFITFLFQPDFSFSKTKSTKSEPELQQASSYGFSVSELQMIDELALRMMMSRGDATLDPNLRAKLAFDDAAAFVLKRRMISPYIDQK